MSLFLIIAPRPIYRSWGCFC